MGRLDKEKLIQEVREKGVEITNISDLMKVFFIFSYFSFNVSFLF